MKVYKNISGSRQDLIGYGSVEADGTIKTQDEIVNPNFQLQEEEKPKTPELKKEIKKESK